MIRGASRIPVLGVAAWSGTGKTTLLARLVPWFKAHGLRVAVIKATHHDVEIDRPGKDSNVLRRAGAVQTVLVCPRRTVLVVEQDPPVEPDLAGTLARFDAESADLVLVEGFRHASFPKIELHRPALGRPLLFPQDGCVIAVAADAPLSARVQIPVLDLNDAGAIGSFIAGHFGLALVQPA